MVEKRTPAKTRKEKGEDQRLAELAELERLAKDEGQSAPDKRPLGYRLRHGAPEQDIGLRIQDARKQAGLTQKDLADRTRLLDIDGMGVSRGALSLYEIGKNSPPPKELRLLCEALKVSPNKLIYGTEDPFDDFADRARYGIAMDGPRTYAQVVYRLYKLHTTDRVALLRLIDGRLYMENRRFEADEAEYAETEFLRMAEELKALRSKP